MTERSEDEVGPRARAPLAGRGGPPGRVKRGARGAACTCRCPWARLGLRRLTVTGFLLVWTSQGQG